MKRLIKEILGQCALSAASLLPAARPVLRPLGLRTSQGLFGNRTVWIHSRAGQPFRLTHVDESFLAFQLFWLGGDYYEPITLALLKALLRPGDRFLDIGAHVGFYSLNLGLSIRGIEIIALEPNPKNFRILKTNIAANGLSCVTCESLAVSDSDGLATLYLTESDMSASLMKGFQAEDTKQIDSIQVSTVSLDSYLRCREIGGPKVIKVDIEGHEPAFFRGASETIVAYKPDIILEVLYEQDPALISQLKSLGYHFYPITDEGMVELDAPRLVKRFPFLFLNHLLTVRPRQELVELFNQVKEAIRNVDLLKTSKHFPKEEWPLLWQNEPAPKPELV